MFFCDTPPNSLRDPNMGPGAKQQKNKKIGARSLIHNTLGIGGLTTFGKKHHSLHIIFCASLRGLHPNIIFSQVSQMGVPKLGPLLFQNFGHSYFSQIKFVFKMQGQCLISFKIIFPTVYSTPQSKLIWPLLSRGLCLGLKFPIWLLPLLLIIIHANHV